MKRIPAFALAVLAACILCSCSAQEREEQRLEQEAAEKAAQIEETVCVVTADSIAELENYPNLKAADLRGSSCYGEIEQYAADHPEVEVRYTVDLNGRALEPDTEELTLAEGEYTLETLEAVLPWLHDLKSVCLPETALARQQLESLRESCPGVEVTYTVSILGEVFEDTAEELNLSALAPEEVEAAVAALDKLPGLTRVELMPEKGKSPLSVADVAALQQAAPDAAFHYVFDLFDKQVSTTDEEIKFANKYIGNREGSEETLRQALDILKGCKRMVLDNCHFKNEQLAQLREDYRNQTKIVWRVWFGKDGGCLTDREVIRYVYGLTSSSDANLIYCEDAKFIDFGHNEALFDVDFVAGMPNLEAIIVSGAPIKDLTPFKNCKKLKFLELAYCGYVEDISPLAECDSLERLNIAFTSVTDLSALDDKNMVVLVDAHSLVPDEERIRFDDLHPDCLVQHSGDQPYGHPWRYNPDKSANEYYGMLRQIFDYAHATNTRY